jgi:hypothetical protein
MTVFVYVNTGKQVGDAGHIKVFANVDAAETWFEANDPERCEWRRAGIDAMGTCCLPECVSSTWGGSSTYPRGDFGGLVKGRVNSENSSPRPLYPS